MTQPSTRTGARLLIATVLAALGGTVPAQGQGTDWPSEAQKKIVADRLATFPGDNLVKDVNWYQPQEAVPGGNAAPLVAAAAASIPADALAQAQALAEAKNSYAFLVWHKGALAHEYYAPGFDRSSQYATASMAKTVVALSLGVAIDRGLIGSLDTPIADLIPTMAGTQRGKIALRDYLQMSSTFETPAANGPDAQVYWQYSLGDNIGEAVARWPETCKARTEFCYANANTAMIGWAIEAKSKMRYAKWLSETIWKPIGASDASLWIDREGGWPRYSCCLHASGQDWLRIGLLILNKGKVDGKQVVSSGWIEQMVAPSPANPNYGLQIWRGSPHNPARSYGKSVGVKIPAAQPFAREDVYYLDGSAGQRVYIVPSAEMVIVRIGAPRLDWDDSELPNILLKAVG